MVFIILNILNGFILILLSVVLDNKSKDLSSRNLVSLSLLATVISFFYAACLIFGFYVNEQLTKIFGSVILFLCSIFSLRFASFCFTYPNKKAKFYHRLFQIAFILLSLYMIFYHISGIIVNEEVGFVIESDNIGIGNFNFGDVYKFIFILIIPLFAVFTMVMRVESIKNRIYRQHIFLICCSCVFVIVLFSLMYFADQKISPLYNSLLPIILTLFIYLLDKCVNISILFDFQTVFRGFFKAIYSLILPSALIGLVLMIVYPLCQKNKSLFLGIFAFSIAAIMISSYYFTKFLRKLSRPHERDYAQILEDELATLDYSGGFTEISQQLTKILQQNLDISSVDILIEVEENELSTVYSTQDKNTKLRLDNPMFDVILNADHPVVFKSHLDTHHALNSAKREIQRVMDVNFADAMIVLKEGRKILGLIFLGPKKLGNVFTNYDLNVFTSLYSYFFVVGYYLKNIANESVVGTVNRELQFSGQIIQSIQENIDYVVNEKFDIGFISKSAHTLGGEFVDFIRLTDNRYMMVLGDLSGKGINASMSMVIVKSIIRTFLAETRDFKVLVQKVNEFIRFNLPKGTFFAGIFMLMDFGDNTFYYLNCGVPALFMYNQAYNNVIEIQGEGKVLGFVKNIDKLLYVKKVKLNPGDMLLACTDGLIDSVSMRGESFGKARVQQSILENLNYPAEKMSNFLVDSLVEFTSKEQEEDVTVVALKCLAK